MLLSFIQTAINHIAAAAVPSQAVPARAHRVEASQPPHGSGPLYGSGPPLSRLHGREFPPPSSHTHRLPSSRLITTRLRQLLTHHHLFSTLSQADPTYTPMLLTDKPPAGCTGSHTHSALSYCPYMFYCPYMCSRRKKDGPKLKKWTEIAPKKWSSNSASGVSFS